MYKYTSNINMYTYIHWKGYIVLFHIIYLYIGIRVTLLRPVWTQFLISSPRTVAVVGERQESPLLRDRLGRCWRNYQMTIYPMRSVCRLPYCYIFSEYLLSRFRESRLNREFKYRLTCVMHTRSHGKTLKLIHTNYSPFT